MPQANPTPLTPILVSFDSYALSAVQGISEHKQEPVFSALSQTLRSHQGLTSFNPAHLSPDTKVRTVNADPVRPLPH